VSTAAVVLAAGGGTRFAGETHKLLARLGERSVVEHAIAAAVDAALDATYVVVGAVDVPEVAGATIVHNPRWADGQSTSLLAGIAAARDGGHDAVVIGLGDQPFVPPEAWAAVAACTATPIATATFDGARRPPVRLAAAVWDMLPSSGDEGARSLLRERPDLVTEVPCPGTPADIDTLEDLNRWS
jgi:CTP:molybdopterin cytidylyltransferase MocA